MHVYVNYVYINKTSNVKYFKIDSGIPCYHKYNFIHTYVYRVHSLNSTAPIERIWSEHGAAPKRLTTQYGQLA